MPLTILEPGYLYWDGLKYITESSTLIGAAGGDLSGLYPNPTVAKIQGFPIAPITPSSGQILEWNGSNWAPANLGGFFTAGGDLSGNATSQTVIGIQGNPVEAQTLGSGQTNFALVWSGTQWSAQNVFSLTEAGGDLGDFYPNPTVRAVWESKVPQAGTGVPPGYSYSGAAYTVGNVLQIINSGTGTQALGYAPLNLTNNVTGVLSSANQASQTLGGDLFNVTSDAVIISLRGNPIELQTLGGNPNYDGYVLTWSYSGDTWSAQPSTTGTALAGDVTGAFSATTVSKLQGVLLGVEGPSNGEVIAYSSFDAAYVNQFLAINFAGDLSGSWSSSSTSSTVTLENIKGKLLDTALASLGATEDGYALTWFNATSEWKALPSGGGGSFTPGGDVGGVSGDLLVVGIQGNPVSATPAGANQVLVQNGSATGSSWAPIVDVNVSGSAAIAGSKIAPNFASQITGPSLLTTGTVEAAYLYWGYTVVSPAPALIAASAVPTGTPGFPNGSLLVNINGPVDGYESLYVVAQDTWVAVGASAAGLASGDLSGNYPGPSVVKIQGNPVDLQFLGSGQNGYILTWNNSGPYWEAVENAFFTTSATGDLSGSYPDPTVIAIQENAIQDFQIGSNVLYDGYVLTWSHTNEWWYAAPAGSGSVILAGDVTGAASSNTVVKINGTSVASFPDANTVLMATSDTVSEWEFITDANIESGANIAVTKLASGTAGQLLLMSSSPLPTWTTMSGDVVISGSGATTVDKIQGVVISGIPVDGYVLTATSPTAASWQFIAGTFSAGGDLSGSDSDQTVIAIQGNPVSATAATAGQFLVENSSASGSKWTSLSGDVAASVSTVGDITVIALQGNAVESQSLGSADDGYVLTWHNTSSRWEALPTGSVTLVGDVIGSTTSNTVIAINGTSVPASPSANQVLVATSGTASTWELISNAQISGSAAIAYSKLSLTGDIVNADINASAAIAYSKLTLTGDVVNADISSSANISVSKLAAGASAQILINSATPTPTWASVTGDVSLTNTGVTTVVALQGNLIQSGTLTSTQDGYVLTWVNADSEWEAKPASSGFTAGGDLTGTSTDQNVVNIHGASVPVAGSLTTGNVLQVSGSSALTYAAVNLAGGSNFVTGTLPAGNQAAQTMTGDVTGTTSASVVAKINGTTVNTAGGSLTTGAVLRVTGASTVDYGTVNLASSSAVTGVLPTGNQAAQTMGGDISGTTASAVVTNIHGASVPISGSLTTGNGLYVTGSSALSYSSLNLAGGSNYVTGTLPTANQADQTMGGDVTGTTAAAVVVALQGNAVKSGTNGSAQDGYVFTWVNTDSDYELVQYAGDVTGKPNASVVVNIHGASVPAAGSLTTGNVLQVSGSSLLTYGAINLAGGANFVTGVLPSGNQAAQTVGGDLSGTTAAATVIALQGRAVAATSPTDQYVLTWNAGSTQWEPEASGGGPPTGTAGGDLSATYPDPTVAAIQGNPIANVILGSAQDGYILTWDNTDGYWKAALSGSAGGGAGGDLSGIFPDPTVVGLQGRPVSSTAPTNQYVLTWNSGTSMWQPEASGGGPPTGSAGGDLSSTYPDPTVVAIQGNPVSGTAATAGQFFVENAAATGSAWTTLTGDVTNATATAGLITVVGIQGNTFTSGSPTKGQFVVATTASNYGPVTLSGDITESNSVPGDLTVININGASVPAAGSLVTGNGLYVTGSSALSYSALNLAGGSGFVTGVLPSANQAAQTMAGDVTGTTAVSVVAKVNGITYPSGSLTTGTIPRATGSSTVAYGALDLANTSAVTGVLPTGNQASQTMGGDVSGTTAAATVIKLQGNDVQSGALGSTQDGYVLTWSNTDSEWEAKPVSGSFTAGGDLTGTSTSQNVVNIHGASVPIAGGLTTGNVLQVTGASALSYGAINLAGGTNFVTGSLPTANQVAQSLTLTGDVTSSGGTTASASTTVAKIQGHPVTSQTLGSSQDGYVLTWDNTDGYWKAEAATGGGGGETGKVIYTSKTITSNYTIDSDENDYYIWCNASGAINVTLPAPTAGRTLNIKDISNNAFTNNISVLQHSSEEIEGVAASYIINENRGSITLASDGLNWWIT